MNEAGSVFVSATVIMAVGNFTVSGANFTKGKVAVKLAVAIILCAIVNKVVNVATHRFIRTEV